METWHKAYIDLEFTGLHRDTTIISLAIVMDDDKFFYAEFNDYNKDQIDPWLEENVIDNLVLTMGRDKYASKIPEAMNVYGNKEEVTIALKEWLKQFPHVQFFGDVPHYDWVLFTSLFGGTVFDLPNNIYYICFDLATYLHANDYNSDVNRESFVNMYDPFIKHNSLHDAVIIKKCFEKIDKQEQLRLENRRKYLLKPSTTTIT